MTSESIVLQTSGDFKIETTHSVHTAFGSFVQYLLEQDGGQSVEESEEMKQQIVSTISVSLEQESVHMQAPVKQSV